jgi:hypothetical protein
VRDIYYKGKVMLPKHLIVNGVLVACLIWDTRAHFKNKAKYASLLEENTDLLDLATRQQAQIKYLCTLMDKQDITVDEFDIIALNNPL